MNCVIELHFLPMLHTYAQMAACTEVLVEAHENYQKGSFRNKTYIAGPQSRNLLTVPLKKGKHKQSAIRSTEIFHDIDWITEHLRTIRTAYGASPFYDFYFPEIRDIYLKKHRYLWDLNLDLLDYLNYRTGGLISYKFTDEYQHSYDEAKTQDYRMYFSAKEEESQGLLPTAFSYSQVHQDKYGFRGDVSVLDLLFHRGPESVWKLKELVQLIQDR